MGATGKALETRRFSWNVVWVTKRRLMVLVALLLLALIGLWLISRSNHSDVTRGTRALIEAYSDRRSIEPRLTGGFKGGEFVPALHDMSNVETARLDEATGLITDAVSKGLPGAD